MDELEEMVKVAAVEQEQVEAMAFAELDAITVVQSLPMLVVIRMEAVVLQHSWSKPLPDIGTL